MAALAHARENEATFHIVDKVGGTVEHRAHRWLCHGVLHLSEARRKTLNGIQNRYGGINFAFHCRSASRFLNVWGKLHPSYETSKAKGDTFETAKTVL
jgi:hypothetical protein